MAIPAMRLGDGRCVRASLPVLGSAVRRRAFEAGIGCSRLSMPTLGGSVRTKGLGAGFGCPSTCAPCRKTEAVRGPHLPMSPRGNERPGCAQWPMSQLSPNPRLRNMENAAFLIPSSGTQTKGDWVNLFMSPTVANQIGVLPLWQIVLAHATQILICFQLAKLLARVVEATSDRVSEGFDKYHEAQQTNGLDTNLYYLVGNAALITLRDMCKYLLPCAVLLFSGWQVIEILTAAVPDQMGKVALIWLGKSSPEDIFSAQTWLFNCVSKLVAYVASLWLTIGIKDEMVKTLTTEYRMEKKKSDSYKILKPLSDVVSLVLVLFGAMAYTTDVGINVRPLLAVGGVGGIAFGLGAQSLMTSVIAGMNLVLSVPFLVGDRIELRSSSGGPVLAGTVQSINLIRTTIWLENNAPVQIPNSQMCDLMISNLSRIKKSAIGSMKGAGQGASAARVDPLEISGTIMFETKVGTKISAVVPDVCSRITSYLRSINGIDSNYPIVCSLQSIMEGNTVNLRFQSWTTPLATAHYNTFRVDTFCAMVDILGQFEGCKCKAITPDTSGAC